MFVCFVLALFCKVTAATLPAVLLLLDWYKGRKFDKVDFFLYLPLFFLSGIFIWLGIQASTAFGHITEMGQTYSFYERIILLFHALWLYLYKFIVPIHQSVIYLFPFKENGSLPAITIYSAMLSLLCLAAMLLASWKMLKHKKEKALLFGILFFLITISIVMPLKWSRTVIIAERYTYLPYIGLTAGLLLVLFNFAKGKGTILRNIFISLLLAYCLIFSFQSFQRNKVWENPITLFTDVIEKDGGRAEKSMGYYNRGNEYFRMHDATNAIADYSNAVEIYPDYREAYYNRGLVYYNVEENDAAIADFSRAIELKSSFIDVYINGSSAYRKAGKYESALEDLNKAIELHPNALAYLGRGVLFFTNLDNPIQACSDWNLAAQMGSEQSKQLLQQYCN